jgi:hypothetical protein
MPFYWGQWLGEQDLKHVVSLLAKRMNLFVDGVMVFVSSYRYNLSCFIYIIDQNK